MATVAEMFALALQNHRAGNLHLAEQLYQQILQADPGHAETHFKLGNIRLRQKKWDEAITHYHQALNLKPNDADVHSNLGLALGAQAKLDEAVAHFRLALSLNPNFAEAHNNLGIALRSQGNWEEACHCFQQALKLNPRFAEAFYNLGNALKDQGQWDDAVAHYRQALQLNPHNANVHNNLGSVLQNQQKLDDAVGHYQQALDLCPNHAEAHRNLGTALQCQGRLEDALRQYQQALQIRPDFPEAHHDQALLRLLQGDFERGWPEYEWRFKLPRSGRRSFTEPLWEGAALDGRTILLHAEQGLGDTLHFVRYAPLVKERGGTVIVECQPPLLRLLAGVPGIDHLLARGSPLPDFNVQAPLLSLPGILHTTLAAIPGTVPYLHADAKLVEQWRNSAMCDVRCAMSEEVVLTSDIGHLTSDFLVGIAWQGNPAFRGDRNRSIPLASFARLAQVEGVQLISLQKGPGTEQLKQLRIADCGLRIERQEIKPLRESAIRNPQSAILDLGDRLDEASGAFMDTAAIMKNLDLVVSSDTAIPHLAGALGVPVWVALPLVPDWRWLLEREDSPWYPTMRLFRQTHSGSWEDVFELMAEELKAVVSCQKTKLLTTDN